MRNWMFLLAAIVAAPAQAAQTAPKTVVYDGAAVIDGTGAPAQPNMAIVTTGGRIAAIVPSAAVKSKYPSATVVDVHGQYALPGLTDSHVHLATAPDRPFIKARLRRYIYSGVTTVRDMAGDTRVLADISRSTLLNEMPGPDIYYAALMAGPNFFHDPRTVAAAQGKTPGDVPWMQAMTMQTDIPLAVARAKGTGATALKLYADMPGALVARIIPEAHRQHMLVWTHAAIFPATPKQIIDAGADVVSHVCMLAYQASAEMPPEYHNRAPVDAAKFTGDNPVTESLFADMKARGTVLDATIYVYKVMWDFYKSGPKPYCTLSLAEKLASEAHRAGVEISTGTDADRPWTSQYPSTYDEIALLVHTAGFTPLEALRASSLIGARDVGQAGQIGTLEPGKKAYIMFTTRDPSADVANLRSVDLTVKGTQQFWRRDFKPITKQEAAHESDL